MKPNQLMMIVDEILNSAKAAVLATIDENGDPCIRWMTPAVLKGRPGTLFTITAPGQDKVCQIKENSRVEWMIQSPSLAKVINLKGKVNVLRNPAIKSEVMENIGDRLTVFWRVNPSQLTDYVVLETVIEEGTYYLPMKGKKETVDFKGEAE